MDKNSKILVGFILASIVLFSGCIENNKSTLTSQDKTKNSAPILIIEGPENAFFGEILFFDASQSYDQDGDIVSYEWDFRDGEKTSGEKTSHMFIFENNFEVEYPLIYTILLKTVDNDGGLKYIEHKIKLYPDEYNFYLISNKLSVEKPDLTEELINENKNLNFNTKIEKEYNLEKSIKLFNCKWNTTIKIEKSFLSFFDSIEVQLFNDKNVIISQAKQNIKKIDLSMRKTCVISGEINKEEEFKFMKITLNGFFIGKKTKLIYGGEPLSMITFNFRE